MVQVAETVKRGPPGTLLSPAQGFLIEFEIGHLASVDLRHPWPASGFHNASRNKASPTTSVRKSPAAPGRTAARTGETSNGYSFLESKTEDPLGTSTAKLHIPDWGFEYSARPPSLTIPL